MPMGVRGMVVAVIPMGVRGIVSRILAAFGVLGIVFRIALLSVAGVPGAVDPLPGVFGANAMADLTPAGVGAAGTGVAKPAVIGVA